MQTKNRKEIKNEKMDCQTCPSRGICLAEFDVPGYSCVRGKSVAASVPTQKLPQDANWWFK